jgi:hypothetical protein
MIQRDNIIAPARLLARDHHFNSHAEWIRNFSAQMENHGTLERAWNGKVRGDVIPAWIDSSRWVATCPFCGRLEAVDPDEKIFFCFNCNMLDNEYEAMPVEFPDEQKINTIMALLMERPMRSIGGPTQYERIARMQPLIAVEIGGRRFTLGRTWHWSQSLDDLKAEQDSPIRSFMDKKKREENNGVE